jgi:hypothetical protein
MSCEFCGWSVRLLSAARHVFCLWSSSLQMLNITVPLSCSSLYPASNFRQSDRHCRKVNLTLCTGQLKCDGTRAETTFRLSAKRTSHFKSAWTSVQSTTGNWGVRISGSNAGYTMFRGSVKCTGYPVHSPISPFTSPPLRHHVPSHFNWSLPTEQELRGVG